jgi:hypothetical protein
MLEQIIVVGVISAQGYPEIALRSIGETPLTDIGCD